MRIAGWILTGCCAVLAALSALAWFVNLDVAAKYIGHGSGLNLERLLPLGLYGRFAHVASDLSTVTTFVPLLVFGFPAWVGVRVLRRPNAPLPSWVHSECVPYPAQFSFFQVWLGLFGTILGLYIGLWGSGIRPGTGGAVADVQAKLDRLLAGTDTALLSTLAGLVGAYVAAQPIPWLFRRLIRPPTPVLPLPATVEKLREELHGLRAAASEVRQPLQDLHSEGAILKVGQDVAFAGAELRKLTADVQELRGQLNAQGIDVLREKFDHMVASADRNNQLLEQQAEGNSELRGKFDLILRTTDRTNQLLEQLIEQQKEAQLAAHEEKMARHEDVMNALELIRDNSKALSEVVTENYETGAMNRNHLQTALETYLKASNGAGVKKGACP